MSERFIKSDSHIFLPIISMFFTGFFFFFFPDRLLKIATGFIFFVLFFSYWYSSCLKKAIQARHIVSCIRVGKGSSFGLDIVIENKSHLPVFTCLVSIQVGKLSHPLFIDKFVLNLCGKERKKVRAQLFASERGSYIVGTTTIQCADLFGFFPFTLKIKNPVKVIVYPAKYPVNLECKRGFPQGKKITSDTAYQDLSQHRSIRNYMAGDELRHINWRVSARLGSLYTNEYDNTLNEPCFIILNLHDTDYPLHLRHYIQEKAISIAAAFVKVSGAKNQLCGFSVLGDLPNNPFSTLFLSPQSGNQKLILDLLAVINHQQSDEQECSIVLLLQKCLHACKSGSHIFYIGPLNAQNLSQKKQIEHILDMQKHRFSIETFFVGDA